MYEQQLLEHLFVFRMLHPINIFVISESFQHYNNELYLERIKERKIGRK